MITLTSYQRSQLSSPLGTRIKYLVDRGKTLTGIIASVNKSLYRARETTIAAIADYYRQAKAGANSLNRASFKGQVMRKSIPSGLRTANIIRIDFIVNSTLDDNSQREFGNLSIDVTADTTIEQMFVLMKREFDSILASHYRIKSLSFSATMAYGL